MSLSKQPSKILRLSLPYLRSLVSSSLSPSPTTTTSFTHSLSKYLSHISAIKQKRDIEVGILLQQQQQQQNGRKKRKKRTVKVKKVPFLLDDASAASRNDASSLSAGPKDQLLYWEENPHATTSTPDASDTNDTSPTTPQITPLQKVTPQELFYILYIYRHNPIEGYSIFRDISQENLCDIDENVITVLLRYYTTKNDWMERIITWKQLMHEQGIEWSRPLLNELMMLMSKYDAYAALDTFNEFFYLPKEEDLQQQQEQQHNGETLDSAHDGATTTALDESQITVPKGMMLPTAESFIAIMKGFSKRGYAVTAQGLLRSFLQMPHLRGDDAAYEYMYALMIQALCRNKETTKAFELFKNVLQTSMAYESNSRTLEGPVLEPTLSLPFRELIRAFRKEDSHELADRISLELDALLPNEMGKNEEKMALQEEQV